MNALRLEWGALWRKRVLRWTMGISLLIGASLGLFFLMNVSTYWIGEGGVAHMTTGKPAIELSRKYDEVYAGEIDEDKLMLAREFFNKSLQAEYQVYFSKELLEARVLIHMIQSTRFPVNTENMPWLEQWIAEPYARDYYDLRSEGVINYAKNIEDVSIGQKIVEMNGKITTPFRYGANVGFWYEGMQVLLIIAIGIMVWCGLLSATVYTSSIREGIYPIVMTTSGRKSFAKALLVAMLLINSMIYSAIVGGFVWALWYQLGSEGLLSTYQVVVPVSPVAMTLGQVLVFQLISGYIGVMTMSCWCFTISALCKTNRSALITTFGWLMIQGLIPIISRFGISLREIPTPLRITQMLYEMSGYSFITMVGRAFWLPYVTLFFGVLQIVVLSLLAIHLRKHMR